MPLLHLKVSESILGSEQETLSGSLLPPGVSLVCSL